MAPSAPGAASSLAAKARRSFCDKPALASEASKQPKHNSHSCNVSRCGVCEEQKQRRNPSGSLQLAKEQSSQGGHGGATTTIAASPRLLSRLKAVSPMKEKRPVSSFATIHTYADLSGGAQAPEAASASRVAPPPPLELLGAAGDSAPDPASPKGEFPQASPTSNELTESALLRSEELLQHFSHLDLDDDCCGTDGLENKDADFETSGSSPSHGQSEASWMFDYSFARPKEDSDTVKVPKVLMKMVVEMWDQLHSKEKESFHALEGLASIRSNLKAPVVPHDGLSASSPSVRSGSSGPSLCGGYLDPLSASSGCLSSASTRSPRSQTASPPGGCSLVAQPPSSKATLAAPQPQCSPMMVTRSQPGWTSPAVPLCRAVPFVTSSFVACAPATGTAVQVSVQSSPPAPACRSSLPVACSPGLARPVAQTVTVTTSWLLS
eukprot:TRINITY_DN77075_c0_g1_i1.p1 TRINITY_DN77075_c0_g1~~TRINITY_DN77075_c0_g1_i1.p1  ORF type:complete len:437 (+),score=75.32 TRINITY_DN77075_c0_g1_i1:131-1441(+)